MGCGATLTLVALRLSFEPVPRFYALLAMGTWLIADTCEDYWFGSGMVHSIRQSRLARRQFLALYVTLVALGVVGDFIFGRLTTALWTYPTYTTAIDFLVLYMIAYPFGGLFTYSLLRIVAGPHSLSGGACSPLTARRGIAVSGAACALISAGFALERQTLDLAVIGFGCQCLALQMLLDTIALARNTLSPVRSLLRRPHLILPLVFVSVIAAFLHEFPNVTYHEWRYENLPLTATVAGIPVLVIAGWPLLVLGSWAAAAALQRAGRDPYSAPPVLRPASARGQLRRG
jgi:hypothetical protein